MQASNLLTSERLTLREIRDHDLNNMYVDWLNDPEVNQFLETRFTLQNIDAVRDYWKAHHGDPDSPWFAICLTSDQRHIGNIKLGPINWSHLTADISLFIGDRSCWGQGYATEAISCLRDWAFNLLELRKLSAGAYAANVGSVRAFERAGFQVEGVLRSQVISAGAPMDIVRLGILQTQA